METVDVIIPFYSGSEWLDEALTSVENQTHTVNRIIVVNDGSKENIDVVKSKHPSVCFYEKENGGAASARNYGLSHSDGNFVFFLDSDDIWANDKVEKQLYYMTSNNYMWCATAYKTFGITEEKVVVPYECDKLCWKHIYNSCRIQTSTVAVRKEALREIDKPFAEDMKNGQDVYLWFLLACEYPLGVLKEPLTSFRIRGSNAHLNYVTHIRVRALLWEKILSDPKLKKTKNIFTIFGYKLCHSLFVKSNGKIEPSAFKKIVFGIAWISFRIANLF